MTDIMLTIIYAAAAVPGAIITISPFLILKQVKRTNARLEVLEAYHKQELKALVAIVERLESQS